MFLVVGLGNPGAEYANTRHNVGFMAADEIHRRYNFSAFRAKFDGLIAEGNIEGEKVYLLKPQTSIRFCRKMLWLFMTIWICRLIK